MRRLAGCSKYALWLYIDISNTSNVGRNYGLSDPRYVLRILIPVVFSSILAGHEDRVVIRLADFDCR